MQSEQSEQSEIVEVYPVQEIYSIEDLVEILGVKRRQVLNYAKTVVECRWESESVFKPAFGKFSPRMLEEMLRLKNLGTAEYKTQCETEKFKPVPEIQSALVISETTAISKLDQTIALTQQSAQNQSVSLADKLQATLLRISQERLQSSERENQLSEAQKLAAQNRGVQQGIELYAHEITARNAVIAQLKAMELKENE